MKKFFVMCFSVLLVAFLSSSFTNTKTILDNDVGYSMTIDQNTTVTKIFQVPVPVIPGESFILIDRGVSVPYLGLINQDAITYYNSKLSGIYDLQTCNRQNWHELCTNKTKIATNAEINIRGVNTRLTDYKPSPKT